MSVHCRYLIYGSLRLPPLGAWPAFERKLAETLDALEEDQYLARAARRPDGAAAEDRLVVSHGDA
jgi:hypothetical protein